MSEPKISPSRINVKRVTLPESVAGQLAARSAVWRIPEQDLVGAAVALLLADDGNLHTRWRAHARVLQQLRLEHHN
jgi:hypothetical protein